MKITSNCTIDASPDVVCGNVDLQPIDKRAGDNLPSSLSEKNIDVLRVGLDQMEKYDDALRALAKR